MGYVKQTLAPHYPQTLTRTRQTLSGLITPINVASGGGQARPEPMKTLVDPQIRQGSSLYL